MKAIDKPCRYCGAKPGEPCRKADGTPAQRPHADRVRLIRLGHRQGHWP